MCYMCVRVFLDAAYILYNCPGYSKVKFSMCTPYMDAGSGSHYWNATFVIDVTY